MGFLLRCACLVAVMAMGTLAQADARKRVTLALSQPALVEAMGASACFAMGGIDAHRQSAAALEAVERFGTTLTAFAEGHEWMGLEPATRPDDLRLIHEAQAEWAAYAPAFHQTLAGDLHAVVMAQLLAGTKPTAARSTALAEHFITAAPDAVAADLIPALRMAANQRVLTQRALRQMCLVHIGLAGDPMRAALHQTLDRIAAAAAQLAEGDADISAPPDGRVARNLRTADLFWSKLRPTLDAVAAGAPTSDMDITKALKLNKSVQKQLTQAIDGYAAAQR
ncbi:MAG: hypothetical protein AAFY38_01585 [Pseudomonadota bacterium]